MRKFYLTVWRYFRVLEREILVVQDNSDFAWELLFSISINFRSADSISFENMIRQLYFKALFFFARFEKILRFSRNEQKPTGHVYCKGADHASLTNHALLSVQFTAHHLLVLALIR